ncbi:hypothetical protein [Clostridium oryzae]|uniref:Uncharacterized protein n=1 Tax=Clostridium oryzae TaxID=1450648 RepID=A0A1V4IXK1_9CLOT|nr:hypothetical protein [Clostridium oryzae]OPJ64676.1 hypothetical protein CLORY_05460 [Clostridium oryzae]
MIRMVFNEDEQGSISTGSIIKEETYKILQSQIVYDSEQDSYITLATCTTEEDKVETVNIDGFSIDRTVLELKGAYIDVKVTEEDGEEYYSGRIYNC